MESSIGKDFFTRNRRKSESGFDFRNDAEIERYYNDLLEDNPDVEKIKENILSCKTLLEAQKAYLDAKDLIEDIPNPNEIRFREDRDLLNESLREPDSTTVGKALRTRKGWE